jgi:hypothetical protein
MKRRQGFTDSSGFWGIRCSDVIAIMIVFAVSCTDSNSAQNPVDTGRFAGTVVFEGKPVAGANVYLRGTSIYSYYRNLPVDFSTKTDKNGHFSFARPVIDGARIDWAIVVTSPGYAMCGANLMSLYEPDNIIVKLNKPSAVSGIVRSIKGEPLENAEVVMAVYSYRGPGSMGSIRVWFDLPELTVRTDRNGRYVFRNVPANSEVIFVAFKPGYIEDSVSTLSGTDDNVIVMAPGGTISGKVTNSKTGNPVAGIRVRAQAYDSSGSDETRTGSDGRYILSGLEFGTYQVSTAPESRHIGLCGWPVNSVRVERTGETSNVDLVLREGIIVEGIVTELKTGKPISGCGVLAEMQVSRPVTYFGASTSDVSFITGSATTNREGRYRITALPGLITFTANGYTDEYATTVQNNRKRLTISETGKQPEVRLALTREETIPGVVYLPDGKPAEGALIGSTGDMVRRVFSNKDGRFVLRNQTPGRTYTLPAEHTALGLEGSVTVNPSSPDTVRIYLKPFRYASVSGKILDHAGAPVAGEPIALYRGGGMLGLLNEKVAVSGPDGSFRVDSLRVGISYVIGARGLQTRSTLPSADTIHENITLVLPKADRWISGRVVDISGAPVSGFNITISSERSGHQEATTDKNGHFRVDRLVGETENVMVWKRPYYPVYFKNIPTNTERNYLFPPQDRHLDGRVVDENGKPVAGARVVAAQAQYTLNSADAETRTDSLGHFGLQRLFGETVSVTVMAAGYKTLQTEQKTNDENVTFVLRKL